MNESGGSRVRSELFHETSWVEPGALIGEGTRVWHFSRVQSGARIGAHSVLGQNVNVCGEAVIGDRVRIQDNVSIYNGVEVEDDVFLGPSCVFTNVTNPRSEVSRRKLFEPTLVRRGATIGANATILCGITVGRYALVGAGAVVTTNVADYALVTGVPARRTGWVSRHGLPLGASEADGIRTCPETGLRYRLVSPGVLRCLDLDEEAPLPEKFRTGTRSYDDILGRKGN